ncbi:MAG: hypothetical protein IPM79_31930 [Polyangiaceae bacterium]|nr:hypothetical protein [Polyangiaceae bacterium]
MSSSLHAKSLTLLAAASLALAIVAAGCGEEPPITEEQDIAETKELFGDDRVADVLKKDLKKVPRSWAEFETLFGVGRACKRTDSKEIYVVEESSTRATGHQEQTDTLLPRAVVTGCNTGEMNPPGEPLYQSYSLMAALFSSPDVPGAASGDPMVFDRVEVMALDRKTGLYNFYVMTPSAYPDKPGILQRIQLRPDDSVYVYTKDPSKSKVSKKKSSDRLCNNCHVNMGPLMNEMHEPWTNWISTHKTLPDAASELTGETRSIVEEAVSIDGAHSRLSLANDLEKTMMAAIRVWNEGQASVPGSGFVQATIDGDQPGGVAGLLDSLFCQTELQYASSFGTVPLELFVDPGAVAGGQLQPPSSYSTDVFPILMPVRADMDERIETALIKKKVVSQRTTIAIRLIDDRNDVFSSVRCNLLSAATSGMPSDATKVDAHLRTFLRGQVDALYQEGPRREYARALLDDAVTDMKPYRLAYLNVATIALARDVEKLQSLEGRAELKARSQLRKDAAKQMFAREANPMPLLHDEDQVEK